MPISFIVFDAHEGDAEGFDFVAGDPEAGDVARSSFDIDAKDSGRGLDMIKEVCEVKSGLGETRADYKAIIRRDYFREFRLPFHPSQVLDRYLPN